MQCKKCPWPYLSSSLTADETVGGGLGTGLIGTTHQTRGVTGLEDQEMKLGRPWNFGSQQMPLRMISIVTTKGG